ncbi:uncharacterized protein [Haliotis cracherodii]|uniref:uncharacterized protein n=1 Tax=Haliotis cracherodii TaxID=6455 RepID=UPI0039EAAC48
MLPGDGGEDVETTISMAGDQGTTITLTATEPALSITDSIDASGVLNMSLGADHHVDILSGGDSQKAIHVVSNNSVAVNVLTKGKTFALSYTANPQLVGGYFSHRVVTHCPENDTCNSLIAIVGIMNSPQIMVTVRSPTVVTINGVNYTDGDVIPVYIFQYEITLLRCKGDISGSQVFTPFPTNVFSGSYCDKVGTFGCDFTFEQIPPKRLLGSQFTIGPFPPSVNGFYRIVASTSNTAIVKDDSSTLTVINEGEFYDIKDKLQISKIESSSPVLLTMLIIDGTSQDSHSNVMIVIQPSTENRKYYRVISPEGYRSYAQMEAPRGLHRNVWINSQLVCSQDIYIEQLNVTLLFVQLEQGIGNVACSDDHPAYGLITYGFRNNLAYGYSALPGKPVKSPEGNSGKSH